MSSIKFGPALSRHPELSSAAEVLEQWLGEHRELSFVDLPSLSRAIGGFVTTHSLLRVLAQLVAADQLQVKYRVSLPDGTLSEDAFDDPSDVPDIIFDSSFQPIETSRDRIVTVYQLPYDHGR